MCDNTMFQLCQEAQFSAPKSRTEHRLVMRPVGQSKDLKMEEGVGPWHPHRLVGLIEVR